MPTRGLGPVHLHHPVVVQNLEEHEDLGKNRRDTTRGGEDGRGTECNWFGFWYDIDFVGRALPHGGIRSIIDGAGEAAHGMLVGE